MVKNLSRRTVKFVNVFSLCLASLFFLNFFIFYPIIFSRKVRCHCKNGTRRQYENRAGCQYELFLCRFFPAQSFIRQSAAGQSRTERRSLS